MDFFLPSLIVLILAAIIVFAFLPRMAPIILLVMSAGLLSFGIYHHYSIFEEEYRFSTWQEQLKIYGPGVVIGVTVLFLIGFILSFFGGPSVPIPEMPVMPVMPSMPPLPEISEVPETIMNAVNTIKNNVMNNFNRNRNVVEEPLQPLQPSQANNRNRRNIRPSFFEEI